MGQVRLIGVAGVGGQAGQIRPARQALPRVEPGHEPPEPQHPPQGRRAVADRCAAPAEQLALAHAQPGGDVVGLGPGPAQQPATKAPRPLCQIRSMHASGRTSVARPPPGGATCVHRHVTEPARSGGGAHSR